MPDTDRLSLRLGPLYGPLKRSAAEHGHSIAHDIRVRLAASLGLPAPHRYVGNPAIAEESAKGVAARLAKRRQP